MNNPGGGATSLSLLGSDRLRAGATGSLTLFLLGACTSFPSELKERIPAESEAPDMTAAHEGSEVQQAADFCAPEQDVPLVSSSPEFLTVPVAPLTNDLSDLGNCGLERDLSGPDGFLAVEMEAGQRWHIRVKEAAEHDVALYVLPECDERTCVAVSDRCPAKAAEHFNFVPEVSGRYLIGVDGLAEGASAESALELAVMLPRCGDGNKGHSEVCDDGNREPGDGCDSECRLEMETTEVEEAEPNDDVYTANVVMSLEEVVTLNGHVGGACDMDVYLFELLPEKHVELSVVDAFGLPCEDAEPLTLEMLDDSGNVVARQTKTDGSCPELHVEDELADAVGSGRFSVNISAEAESTSVAYQLILVRHDPGDAQVGDTHADD